MTDFGQFEPPFAEVPLDPSETQGNDIEEIPEPAEVWWVDDEEDDE